MSFESETMPIETLFSCYVEMKKPSDPTALLSCQRVSYRTTTKSKEE